MVKDTVSDPALHIVRETIFTFSGEKKEVRKKKKAFIYSLQNLEKKNRKCSGTTLLPHNSSSLCGCCLEADKQ